MKKQSIYETFLKVLDRIENSGMSTDEQMELLKDMEHDIAMQKQQVYAWMNET